MSPECIIITAKYLATLLDYNVRDNKTKNDLHWVKKGSTKLNVSNVSNFDSHLSD